MKPYLDYDGLAVLAHRGGVEESYEILSNHFSIHNLKVVSL